MRLYTFINFYLSSIQQGIQSAHCVADMFVKYSAESKQQAVLFSWAGHHKTMICLNGGNADGILSIHSNLQVLCPHLELPYCKFHEDDQSLNGMATCCGVIVPEHIYEAAAEIRRLNIGNIAGFGLSSYEYDLAQLINQYGLAR